MLEPIATGLLASGEATIDLLAEVILRGPAPLQSELVELVASLLVNDALPSIAPSEGVDLEASGLGPASRAALADLAHAVFGLVSPKIDSCVPAASSAAAVARLLDTLAIAREHGASKEAGVSAPLPRQGPSPIAQALGHLGRSKTLRPAIVKRLVGLMWSGGGGRGAGGEAGTGVGGGSSPAPAGTGGKGRTANPLLQYSAVAALFCISGHPGARADMGQALGPLIDLLQPAQASIHRAAAGLAAGTLFRLSAHLPFLAALKQTELPSLLAKLQAARPPLEA